MNSSLIHRRTMSFIRHFGVVPCVSNERCIRSECLSNQIKICFDMRRRAKTCISGGSKYGRHDDCNDISDGLLVGWDVIIWKGCGLGECRWGWCGCV
jgi:hypothetical protein